MNPAQASSPTRQGDTTGPPTPLLTVSFFLAGLGTVLLGPLLPQLLHEWALTDQRGGLLLLAKFAGSFVGGISVPNRLRIGIFAGHLLAAAGFVSFACAHGLALALPSLFIAGLGLGEIIASTNILAGHRFPTRTGSALALINLFWSLGAVSTGLLAAALLPGFGWRKPTLAMATMLLLVGLAGVITPADESLPANEGQPHTRTHKLEYGEILRFGGLLLLYGGLETCLTAWLTTFALRFTHGRALLGGQSAFVVLWVALTVGRGLASVSMRSFAEVWVQRVSLVFCFFLIGWLAVARTPASLAAVSILLGFALAPVFPSTFALLLRRRPAARVAGAALAMSGIGAAIFPWLMGAVSTHTGSLRLAMLVPAGLVPAMLALTLTRDPAAPRTNVGNMK